MGITESKRNRSAELQHIKQQEHTERAAKLSRQPQSSSLLIYSEWIHPLRTSRGSKIILVSLSSVLAWKNGGLVGTNDLPDVTLGSFRKPFISTSTQPLMPPLPISRNRIWQIIICKLKSFFTVQTWWGQAPVGSQGLPFKGWGSVYLHCPTGNQHKLSLTRPFSEAGLFAQGHLAIPS